MQYLVVFLLALLRSVAPSAMAQSARHREAVRLSRKRWRVIDMTRKYVPQFQAHVILNQSTRDSYTRCPGRTDTTRLYMLTVYQCYVV